MTSRPRWIALTGVMFLCGCQTMDSLTFWRNSDDARFTAEELAALDAQPIQPLSANESPLLSGGPAPIAPRGEIVQASYGTDAAPPAAAQRVEQLVQSGQSVVAQSQSDPTALQTARSYFEQALALDGNHAGAHHGMAIVADLTHDYPTAEMHYKQALVGQPNDANLLNDLGYSYILQHRFADAASFLNRAAQVAPQNKQPRVNLALLALKKGNRAEAQRVLAEIYPADQVPGTLAELESRVQPAGMPEMAIAGTAPAMPGDPGVAAQDVLQRVQQERERAQAERQQTTGNQQPIHVYPPSVAPGTGLAANPNLISVPGGQQFQIDTPSYGTVMSQGGFAGDRPMNSGMSTTPGMTIPGNMTAGMPSTGSTATSLYPVPGQMPVIQSAQDIHGQAMSNVPVAQPYQPSTPASRVSLQSAPVAGLNAGPGALFPVASMQRVPVGTPGMQPRSQPEPSGAFYPAANTPAPALTPAPAAPGMPGQANYAPYGQPAATAPPTLNTYPQQRLPNPSFPPATSMNSAVPTADPLEAYERQLQSLDNQYHQAVQQLDARGGAVQPVPAQY